MAILAQLLDDVIVHKFELDKTTVLIGRSSESDIVINDTAISAKHAQVLRQSNAFFASYMECFIEDLASTNGTWINEQPVQGRQRLRNGDIVRLAWNRFKFVDEHESEMEKTVHMLRMND